MEVNRLRYFARVAEDGSLTKAAGVLRIAQPALSRQMRLLEEELGVSLFNRTSKGMQLTNEGEYLFTAITGHLRGLDLAVQNVRSLSSRFEGNFAIGLPPAVSEIYAARIIHRLGAELPNVKLRIVEGSSGSLVGWLNRGIVDFAVIEGRSNDDRLSDIELLATELVLVGPGSAALDPTTPKPFAEVAGLPLILSSHHLGVRAIITEAAAQSRVRVATRLEVDAVGLIKNLVAEGMGFSILPELYLQPRSGSGELTHCPIGSPSLQLVLFLSSRRKEAGGNATMEDLVTAIISDIFR